MPVVRVEMFLGEKQIESLKQIAANSYGGRSNWKDVIIGYALVGINDKIERFEEEQRKAALKAE